MSRKCFKRLKKKRKTMKKTELNGCFYDFTIYCDAIAVDDILDIHKYLMKKNGVI